MKIHFFLSSLLWLTSPAVSGLTWSWLKPGGGSQCWLMRHGAFSVVLWAAEGRFEALSPFLQFCCLTLPVSLRKWEPSLVTCTDGTSLILGCKWTRRDKLIQSKQHLSFRHLFNVAETQLGLWTWIWGVYSREILKSYGTLLVYVWKLTRICCFSLYPILNSLPCSFYPRDLWKLLTLQL